MWNLQICSEYFILLVEPISIRFCLLTCRKQKLVRSKILQQELFVLISDFWQFRHSFLGWDRSNLKKIYVSARKLTWKIDNIKSHLGIRFNETVRPSTKGGEHYYIELLRNKKQKENRLILCVYMQWKSTKMWRALIHRMVTKRVKNEQIKRLEQTCSLCFVSVCSNSKKANSRLFKRISRK